MNLEGIKKILGNLRGTTKPASGENINNVSDAAKAQVKNNEEMQKAENGLAKAEIDGTGNEKKADWKAIAERKQEIQKRNRELSQMIEAGKYEEMLEAYKTTLEEQLKAVKKELKTTEKALDRPIKTDAIKLTGEERKTMEDLLDKPIKTDAIKLAE